jgi:hypothetical protein
MQRQSFSGKWRNRYAITAALMAFRGATDREISKVLKVNPDTFSRWKTEIALLRVALKESRELKANPSSGMNAFKDYALGHLPEDLRKLWNKINWWADHPHHAEKVKAILAPYGTQVRQAMWLHAYIAERFNASAACRSVNIPRITVDSWKKDDPDFRRLCAELVTMRNDFFESQLISLVARGDSSAIIFANRTANRERGYGEQVDVKHSGSINIYHQHTLRVDQLGLPLETRRQLRQAFKVALAKPVTAPETKALPPSDNKGKAKGAPAPLEVVEEEDEE